MAVVNLCKKILAVSMALILLVMPLLAQDSTGEYMQGKIDGERDARGEGAWFFAGCLLGATGILIAYIVEPNVPAAQLVGKSNAYVLGYSDGYKRKTQSLNAKNAMTGCGISVAAWLVLYVALIASAESSTEY